MKKIAILLLMLLTANQSHAYCFKKAADYQHVDERLMRAISKTENSRGDPRLIVRRGRWEFIGLMMVSTIWLPVLRQYGIDREQLFDPCTNVKAGAYILAEAISRYGFTWKAVGAYNTGVNSSDVEAQKRYVKKVWNNFNGVTS